MCRVLLFPMFLSVLLVLSCCGGGTPPPPPAPPTLTSATPASGGVAGGTAVRFVGTNLSGASAVNFGGVPATAINIESALAVTCVTPAGNLGSADVQVVTPNGAALLGGGFTYYPPPLVTACAPDGGPLGGGTTVTINGSGFAANDPGEMLAFFGGVAASSVTVLDDGTLEVVTPARLTAGAVDLVFRNRNGDAVLADGFAYYEDGVWIAQGGGIAYDYPGNVAVFPDGSFVVIGAHYDEPITFGLGEPNETTLPNEGGGDIFVARYDAHGALRWASSAGGPSDSYASGVAAFPDGSVAVCGHFRGDVTFGPGETNETTLSAANNDGYLARFDENGLLSWVRQLGSPGNEHAHSVAAYADGDCLLGGYFYGSLTLGPGETNETALGPAADGKSDVFLARYDENGLLRWAVEAASAEYDSVADVAVNADGSALLAGRYGDDMTLAAGLPAEVTLPFDGMNYDLFVARYDADGILEWAVHAGGPNDDAISGLDAFPDGSFVICGRFEETAVFGPAEAGETLLTAEGGRDAFVARYASTGALLWAIQEGGPSDWDSAGDVAALAGGGCAIAGQFNEPLTLGEAPDQITLTPGGSVDSYVARYDGDGVLLWVERGGGSAAGDSVYAYAMGAQPSGGLIMVGEWFGDLTWGAGTPDEVTVTSSGDADVFAAHLMSDGWR